MGVIRKIFKNTVLLFASRAISQLLSFGYFIFLARYLGPTGFGVITFATAFAAIFGIIAGFGFQLLIVREVARDHSLASKYLINISFLKSVLSLISYILMILFINLLGYSEETKRVVYLIGLSVIFNSFTQMLYSVSRAFEKMEFQSIGQVLNSSLMFVGIILAINYTFTLVGFSCIYLFVSIVVLGYNIIVLQRKLHISLVKQKVKLDIDFIKFILKESLPFGLAMAFVMIFYWIDSVMLSLLKGQAVVGWYNAAYRLVLALLFIPQSFIAAIYPVMSRFNQTSNDLLKLSFEKSFRYLTIIGIPIGVLTTMLAGRAILLIYDSDYTNAILPLQILIWSSVMIFMNISFGNLFNCLNKQSIVTKITAFCVVMNIILNLILIPKYSLVGASMATVFTEVFSLFFSIIYMKKMGFKPINYNFLIVMSKIIISCLVMFFFIFYVRNLPLFILAVCAFCVYCTVLYLLGGFDSKDLALLKSTINK